MSLSPSSRRRFSVCILSVLLAVTTLAQSFTETRTIDFYRDVASRDLRGLGTRSDGRLVPGPTVNALDGEWPVDALLWSFAARPDGSLVVGSGPDATLWRVTPDADTMRFETTPLATFGSGHLHTVAVLPDGTMVTAVSPSGRVVHLDADGEILGEVSLPVAMVFDLLPDADGQHVWVATGSPARVYRIDLATMADAEPELWGEVRDRNLRRLAMDRQGRVLAGSAPSANLYRFTTAGAPPEILWDEDDGEITDLHVTDDGDLYVVWVSSSNDSTQRVARGSGAQKSDESGENQTPPQPVTIMEAAPSPGGFSGRSSLVRLPGGDGLPELVVSRNNVSIYRIVPRGDVLLLAGGDEGELLGYDLKERRSLTFAGSESAQINDLLPASHGSTDYWGLGNNPAALLRIDFAGEGIRSATTRRLDLRTLGRLGALRFNRLRELAADDLQVELRVNRGRDTREGWSAWTAATETDGAWLTPDLQGRYVQVRLTIDEEIDANASLDRATLYHAPQNRRPSLQAFHIAAPGYSLIPRAESSSASLPSLSDIVGSESDNDSRNSNGLMSSSVMPDPGMQIVAWSVNDYDGDQLRATFAVRPDGDDTWLNLIENSAESWLQFDRRSLPEGTYFTRLTIAETAPRAPAERHEITFETDDLVIDMSAPRLRDATVTLDGDALVLSVMVADEQSLPVGIEVVFNNGYRTTLVAPADGILDQLEEHFRLEVPQSLVSGASAVEIFAEDAAGNRGSQRLALP
ncbi:esterase-like activity of phytase family protein [Actomonas aquatica]|uniref:Esterase-like activity of phytase family protein n=1 Tax=Actomonas aquatica TaxID=2866162 RepID=A0ABZ1C9M7_9BACT|nr:esterase-like activity of phytase family protein [Opitutus sp. WL0086]WRQ88345.1 esterase-like activity of phytase family protein [Opitutus sp. WL0086]